MATKFISPSWRMPKNSNQSKASNYSLKFDGSNTKITFDPIALGTADYTISAWAKRDSTGNMFLFGSTASYGYGAYFNGTTNLYLKSYHLLTFNNAAIQTALARTDWVNWVFKRDNTANTVAVYVDGVLAESITPAHTVSMGINSIGASGLPTGTQNVWDGSISQVSIFDYALSTGSISALYNSGIPANPLAVTTPPIAYYDLGQGSAYASGSAGIVEPNLAQATGSTVFEFNGTDNYINLASKSTALVDWTQPYSISLWVKYSTALSWDLIATFGVETGNTSTTRYIMIGGNSGYLFTGVGDDKADMTTIHFNIGSGLDQGEWHHIVYVGDGSSGDFPTVYIDGNEESYSGGTTALYNDEDYLNVIGVGSTATGRFFPGKISNVQIFNQGLNATNILSLYNNGTPIQSYTDIPQSGSLKAWYKLGLDTSVYDTTNTRWAIEDSSTPYNGTINFQI